MSETQTSERTVKVVSEKPRREYPEVGVKKPEEVAEVPSELPSPEELQFREKISEIITELVFDAQEVGFELATLDCPNVANCPLVEKSRKLIKKVKELFELQREITKTRTRRPR